MALHPAYARMARELAPYQGRPRPMDEPRPVGDPLSGFPGLGSESPDAGSEREAAQARAPLSESVPELGGVLVPPTYGTKRPRRRRR